MGWMGRSGWTGRTEPATACPMPAFLPDRSSAGVAAARLRATGRRCSVIRWSRTARICASASPPSCGIRRLRIVAARTASCACPGRNCRGVLAAIENPVRLQPVVRHPQIRREIRRRLILGNRAEHVALLALQQLEQLLARPPPVLATARPVVRLERPDRCSRSPRSTG